MIELDPYLRTLTTIKKILLVDQRKVRSYTILILRMRGGIVETKSAIAFLAANSGGNMPIKELGEFGL